MKFKVLSKLLFYIKSANNFLCFATIDSNFNHLICLGFTLHFDLKAERQVKLINLFTYEFFNNNYAVNLNQRFTQLKSSIC